MATPSIMALIFPSVVLGVHKQTTLFFLIVHFSLLIAHFYLKTKPNYQPTAAEFKRALEPLQNYNLLLTALLQFPESFHYEK